MEHRTPTMSLATSPSEDDRVPGIWLAAPIVALLAWWTVAQSVSEDPWCFLDNVNLAFHEAGHPIFSPLGSTLHILGGTLGQLLVPAGLAAVFLFREKRPFAAAVCSWWLGENFINISRYMADARDLALPLVGGGDHDWNELFYRFGKLSEGSVATVSRAAHHLGVVVMLLALLWCIYFMLPRTTREFVREVVDYHLPALRRMR